MSTDRRDRLFVTGLVLVLLGFYLFAFDILTGFWCSAIVLTGFSLEVWVAIASDREINR